jgi:hypothetical protein
MHEFVGFFNVFTEQFQLVVLLPLPLMMLMMMMKQITLTLTAQLAGSTN